MATTSQIKEAMKQAARDRRDSLKTRGGDHPLASDFVVNSCVEAAAASLFAHINKPEPIDVTSREVR